MKITNKTITYILSHDIQIGELTATVEAMVFYTNADSFDVDFADILDIKYMGVSIDGYDNWQKFKNFHKEMGIDYGKMIDDKFTEVFTKAAVLKLIKAEK
jgi:hypothetical protein